ncbi:ArnT family glycosyltransferase, partial [Patescibacteria group bacterium]
MTKSLQKRLVIILIIIVVYFLTRLVNLTAIPIFMDESIYIRWSQIGSQDAAWRFISLTDGKQPMFTWAMMILFKVVNFDPLIIGRLVSVISGFVSLIGLGFLSFLLFKNYNIAVLSMILYTVSPFTVLYDRLALYDSMVAAFFIWATYFSILLVRYIRLDIAMILGLVIGGGILNKSSGFFSLYLLPFCLILFDWKQKKPVSKLVLVLGLMIIVWFLSNLYYLILRLSPLFHMVALKNTVFLYTIGEWFSHPFRFLYGNLRGLFDWLIGYLTLPVFAISMAQVFNGKKYKEKLLLYTYWLLPFLALGLFAKVLYPRFILFMSMPLF